MYSLLSVTYYAAFLYAAAVFYWSLFSIALVLLIYFIYHTCRIPFFAFVPFLWIVVEDVRTFGPFRATADHISYSMAIYPYCIQFIDITGPHGITAWLILTNVLLYEALARWKRKRRAVLFLCASLITVIVPSSYSLYRWNTMTFNPDVKIAMVQPNIPLEEKMSSEYALENMYVMQSMTAEALKQKPDLVIWPESAYPYRIDHWIDRAQAVSIPEISTFARRSDTPILIGAEYMVVRTEDDYDSYNAALLMDSRGKVADYYGKIYLVPFAEGIPFKKVFGVKKLWKKGVLSKFGDFSPGNRYTLFEIEQGSLSSLPGLQQSSNSANHEKIRFAALICYEGLYPELSRKFSQRGADFLICMTNDAWFGRTLFPYWHARALRMRAIENRISIARCANTGISSLYDPAGRMYQSTELFTRSIISGMISTVKGRTFYTRYGDIIVYIAYTLCTVVLLVSAFMSMTRHMNKKDGFNPHDS